MSKYKIQTRVDGEWKTVKDKDGNEFYTDTATQAQLIVSNSFKGHECDARIVVVDGGQRRHGAQ